MTILCYHPIGYCYEPAVATATSHVQGTRPLCEFHLRSVEELAALLPEMNLTVHPLFIPAVEEDPNNRLGD